MIRLVIIVLFIVIFLILSLPVQLITWLLAKKWPAVQDKVSKPMVSFAFKVVMLFASTKLTVIGKEKIPTDKAVLYVGNHRSFFDIVTTYTLFPRPTGFLAKIELKKIPGLNIWMSLIHCIFLDRKDIKQGMKCILKCIENINNGISVAVFPEGTRNKVNDTFLPFHDATLKIAVKTNCPIVPMVIHNSAAIFEDHLPFIKKSNVTIEFLDPIYYSDFEADDKKHPGAYLQKVIEEAYFKNN